MKSLIRSLIPVCNLPLLLLFMLLGCSPEQKGQPDIPPEDPPADEIAGELGNPDIIDLSSNIQSVFPDIKTYISDCDTAFSYYLKNNWSEKTGLIYTTAPDKVRSSADCVNGMFHWYQGIPGGYGEGMGDCALIEGTILSGIARRWEVEKDPEVKSHLQEQAGVVARGLFNLAELHGIKGFVARGICADDGKSICSLTSIDQYTHWEHGLWRYATSGMASDGEIAEYKRLVVEVAQFMKTRVTEENGWNFGLADGTIPDPRGICTMWGNKKPHAAARLLMVYCAAFLATKDTQWLDMYENYVDKSIEMTAALKTQTEKTVDSYPCYSLYQAMCSLELIMSYETNPERRAELTECMAEFSRRAHIRLEKSDPANPPYGMCWEAELLLAEFLDPSYEICESDIQFIKATMERNKVPQMGWCRAAHIYSMLWHLVGSNYFSM